MTKQEFLAKLRKGLSGLPKDDIEERLTFYSEIIDDRIEEGLSEDEAVSAVGTVEDIVLQIVADTPITKIAKERIKPKRRLMAWEIILLVLGAPIWLSLIIAAFSVVLSIYVSIWSVIISMWSVFASLIGCSFGGIVAGIGLLLVGNTFVGIALVGAGIVGAGLAIFAFYGCRAATKGIVILTKKILLWAKNCFRKKEEA